MVDVRNAEALEARFGGWPSFHDAEVLGVRLDSGQRSDGQVRLEVDIHVFAVDGLMADGRMRFVQQTLVTIEFVGAENIRLDGFGPQNVLDELLLTDRAPAPSAARIHVDLQRPSPGHLTVRR